MYSYDETKLSDNPDAKKAPVQYVVKCPEIIRNSSKVCISIIQCGSTRGEILLLCVVYKAANVKHMNH